MREFVHIFAEYAELLVNFLAIGAIVIGALVGTVGVFRLLLSGASEDQLRPAWLSFGRWLVLGLTFQLAADIIETTLAPTWDDIGKLAAIAAVRTALTYFLDRDMEDIRKRGEKSPE